MACQTVVVNNNVNHQMERVFVYRDMIFVIEHIAVGRTAAEQRSIIALQVHLTPSFVVMYIEQSVNQSINLFCNQISHSFQDLIMLST